MHNTEQQADKYRNHAQVWLLLPWYINGSLSTEQRQRIAEHAAVCLSCRKELGLQSTLRDAVKTHELDELRVSASFDRLSAKLQAEDEGIPVRSAVPAGFTGALKRWWPRQFTPRYIAGALTVLALVVILPGVVANLFPGNNTFKTLSDGRPETVVAADLRLIFADGVSESDRNAILDGAGLRIVSGPDQRGLYFVSAADDVSPFALAATLGQLRDNEKIMFAELAIGTPANTSAGER